jgi:hypothetical protein
MSTERNMVLVVGATGSLGSALVPKLEQSGIPLRILGRSRESFVKAGLTSHEDLDLVVCPDVTNRGEFRDEWFLDVKAVICVARPRAGKHGDQEAYMSLIQNLSDAVCDNGVPHMLLLSIPYLDRFLFGSPVASQAMQASELSVVQRFVAAEDSKLSIVRIAELSEIGILLNTFRKTRVWPCIIGYNPCVQPISAGDFATAVANLLTQEPSHVDWRSEFLWGGPQVYTWRQVGSLIEDAIGKRLFFISVPLLLAQFWISIILFAGRIFPFLIKVATLFQLLGTVMTANATSEKHEKLGKDTLEEYLLKKHEEPAVDKLQESRP